MSLAHLLLRQARVQGERPALAAFTVAGDGRVTSAPEGASLPQAAVGAVAAWLALFLIEAGDATDGPGLPRLRAATRLTATTEPLPEGRLADVVCEKLGQLQPRHANVLVVGHEGIGASGQFLRGEMLRLQQRVERNDERLIQRYSFRGRAEFFRGLQRLSALFCRGTDSAGAPVLAVWLNPQAREPLPDKVRSALQRCLAARSWSSD